MAVEYRYELKSLEQKRLIDLTKYEEKLQNAIKSFLEDSFTSVVIDKNGYTLKLKDELNNTQKRNLGKHIVNETGLKEYLDEYIYNNNKGRSTQLFIIKKR